MKRILLLLIAVLVSGCENEEKIMPKETAKLFKNICAGRYTLDVPIGSTARTGFFSNDFFHFSFQKHDKENEDVDSLMVGDGRLKIWSDKVEKRRSRGSENHKYIHKKLNGETKLLSYYKFFEYPSGKAHMLGTYFYRDIPIINQAVTSIMSYELTEFDVSVKDYMQQFQQNLKLALAKQEQIIYQPWPHNQLGVCINEEILINTPIASEEEIYTVMWHNGKESLIELRSRAYGKDGKQHMQGEIDSVLGVTKYFASSKMQVAGRQGRVIINGGRYSSTEVVFTWIATDAKAGSTRFPYLEITGYVEMKDFPEIAAKGLNETDLAIGWLKSIQVRENGMVGTR